MIMHVALATYRVDEHRRENFGNDFRAVAKAAAGNFFLNVLTDGPLYGSLECGLHCGAQFRVGQRPDDAPILVGIEDIGHSHVTLAFSVGFAGVPHQFLAVLVEALQEIAEVFAADFSGKLEMLREGCRKPDRRRLAAVEIIVLLDLVPEVAFESVGR